MSNESRRPRLHTRVRFFRRGRGRRRRDARPFRPRAVRAVGDVEERIFQRGAPDAALEHADGLAARALQRLEERRERGPRRGRQRDRRDRRRDARFQNVARVGAVGERKRRRLDAGASHDAFDRPEVGVAARTQAQDVPAPERCLDEQGRPRACQLPGVHDRHAVAQRVRFVHEVRGQQHGDRRRWPRRFFSRRWRPAAAPRHFSDDVPGVPPGKRVHPRGGLVQEHHARLADERDRQAQPAPLPAGERSREPIGVARQAGCGERRGDARRVAFAFASARN